MFRLATDVGWTSTHASVVEVTSEDKDYPVESAPVSGTMQGWRAASPGTQTIRLLFDQPQKLRRISLVFEETATRRAQEFVSRWSTDGGRSFGEIVRSNGVLVPLTQYARSKSIELNFPTSGLSNWSLCLTSVEDRLAPRSRVCACLDRLRPCYGITLRRPLVALV